MPLSIKIRQGNQRNSIKVKEVTDVIVDTVPNMKSCEKEPFILTLGGRVWCPRCQAKSKRTKLQCQSPAVRGKRACRIHGGLSTGPKTKAGRIRCADAKTIHGRETRQNRSDTSSKLSELYELEVMARAAGIITGPKVRGRTPGS
jgi:hypothetical protein